MLYTSTRSSTNSFSFEEAILGGYAPDGGLYVPQCVPSVAPETLERWMKLSFVALASEILSLFVSDVSAEEIEEICRLSFQGFDEPVVPVEELDMNKKSIFVAELFHGPTFCFKDLGLRVLINFMAHCAVKRNQQITLIVATTGDTGPAAVQAVEDSGCDLLSIIVHYPKGQISDFQRKQMTTVRSSRVKIVEFEGGGDDMDSPIKSITSDKSISNTTDRLICGINSFNIGRPIAQIVHFVWIYLRVTQNLKVAPGSSASTLDLVIPTGAMGNMAGARMAKEMGIPFGVITAGVNINDFTDIAFRTGEIVRSAGPMKTTLSEAINVQLPYNLERLLFYLTNQNHELVRKWYLALEEEGRFLLDEAWLAQLQSEFQSARVPDADLCSTIQMILDENGYWADPHTGVAFAAAKQTGYFGNDASRKSPVAIVATASPCKFESAMVKAVGHLRWQGYESSSFPERGRTILTKAETAPIFYSASAGFSLEENQKVWEQKTRDLIKSL